MGIILFILVIIIFLYSIILHEISHGAMANHLGDPTAKLAGRLTLNPLKHLDPIGSVLLPFLLLVMGSKIVFGWAKPVPINPLNLRDKKYGSAKVAAAGPLANIIMAVTFGLIARFFLVLPYTSFLFRLGIIFGYICGINLLLAIFNLVPIPPLDGSHILFSFLGERANGLKIFLSRYGFFILLIFIFFFTGLLFPVVNFFFRLIVGKSFAWLVEILEGWLT
ncbi:site-2 protease family protein [bacterium]|nr:site-2 protease family protein [bacterium]